MVRRKAIGARRNPFADPDEWMDEDFELLRERAKIYMARREWDRALLNLNRTLYHWGAKFPEKYDYDDPPNKQVHTYLTCTHCLKIIKNPQNIIFEFWLFQLVFVLLN